MNPPTSTALTHKSSVELFNIRIKTRLCVAVLCMLQIIPRTLLVIQAFVSNSPQPAKILLIDIPFAPMMGVIIGIEYLLFKKKGSRILRYSHLVDILLLLLFMTDWLVILIDALIKVGKGVFTVSYLFAFTSFSWRVLAVTLLFQKWQLKIILPVVTLALCTGFAIYYDPSQIYPTLCKSLSGLFNVVFIIYCDDKLKWKIMWTNLQQQQWTQVNNFILNNIPENIMILDLKGEIQFISDYCKSFMENFNLSLESKDFLHRIHHLHQQQQNEVSHHVGIQIERMITAHELLEDSNHEENLENVLGSFRRKIVENNIQERQFLVYNGKLQPEENQQEKAIEVKISFVQHFENLYVILILRDTTQRDLLITLEETNKYKDQLLASVSHELRAPLNGNINLVETAVNSPKVSEDIKESWLIPALRSSQFLLHLINDILDMSQIKEQKLRLTFQPGNLKETLKSTAQLIELQAKKKGIDLLLELDQNLPKIFCTDHIRLSQIVLNLLSNAMKFTKQGTIKLTAIPMNLNRWIKIIVEDSGIGISAENMNKLFSNFTHIEFEGRQGMDPTGTGLGLNIAYNLVQLLSPQGHQSINVMSTPNKGSTFSFIVENKDQMKLESENLNDSGQIPEEFTEDIKPILLPKVKIFEASSTSTIHMETSCSCPEILIVDDNPFNTMAFETILSSLEIKCDAAYGGSSAIEKLISRENKKCGKDCKQYSVIFMDQEMPEMNGSETVQEIRRLQREKLLPQKMKILGCTAHKSKVEIERFLASGLDGCIQKPISITMIKDILF